MNASVVKNRVNRRFASCSSKFNRPVFRLLSTYNLLRINSLLRFCFDGVVVRDNIVQLNTQTKSSHTAGVSISSTAPVYPNYRAFALTINFV